MGMTVFGPRPEGRDRSVLIVAAVLGLLVLVAVSAVLLAILRGGGDGVTVPTFSVPEGEPTAVPGNRITVSASGSLQPEAGITYGPENTIDGDLATAWNSDTDENQGRGERLTYRFAEPVDLRAIRFINGYAKNEMVFNANHRIQSVVVITDSRQQPINLADTDGEQEVALDFGLTSKVIMQITEIYQGDGFSDPNLTTDLALTDVVFVAVQR